MKTRVFLFFLTLAAAFGPTSVLAVETRDAKDLGAKVKCQEAALKDFKAGLPEDVKIEDVLKSSRTSKVSGDAA